MGFGVFGAIVSGCLAIHFISILEMVELKKKEAKLALR
jgi:uncharacterized integral membrane protein